MSEAAAEVQKAYNDWAHQYDVDDNPARDFNAKVLRQLLFDLTKKVVLEIGCGTGLNTIWLADRAQYVFAIEIAEGMLRQAYQCLEQRNVVFLQADLTKP